MRVLVLDDEALVRLLLVEMIDAIGHESVEAGTVDEAMAALSAETIDCAMVDLNLGGVKSYPVADALAAAQVPFAFSSGYDELDVEPRFAARPFLTKPFRLHDLEAVITRLGHEARA